MGLKTLLEKMNSLGYKFTRKNEFNKAKKDIADLYNVLYLDMARETGFNLSFESMVTELQLDSIHPNYKAHEIMGSRLTGFIASH